jgi:polyisoprenoid-binding protein YceI
MKTKRTVLLSLILLSSLLAAGPLAAAEYQIDTAHSTVGFQVRHMAISRTNGIFDEYSGTFNYDPDDPGAWSCEVTIQAASVNTNNDKRDEDLRSPNFFDVAKFPTLTFKSTGVALADESEGTLTGDLTIHGVTKPVVLDLEVLGTVTDPWDNERAGFSATTRINRKDFGLQYNNVLETGGLVVGDEVKITLEIEGIKKKQ